MISISTHPGYTKFLLGPVFLLGVAFMVGINLIGAQKKASTGNLEEARSAMAAGVAAANHGSLDEAKRDFARAVALAPKVSATHAALGSILLGQHDLEAAIRELEVALALDPTDVSTRLNLGRAKVAAGQASQAGQVVPVAQFKEAVQLFRDALASVPPPVLSEDELIAYTAALAATGDNATAESVLKSALAGASDSAALNDALGALLAQNGHVEEALPLFQRAIATDPSLAQAQYHLGVALLTLNRPQDALAPLEIADSAMTHSFDVELQLGRAFSALHRDNEAMSHLHRAAEIRSKSTSTQSLYELALALQASGDAKAALPLFELSLADLSAADNSALINDALAHVQTGDTVHALPLYTRALQLGPDSATLREDFGVAYLQQSDLTHAIEQFQTGLAIEPGNAHLHYDLGLALKLKDDLAAAVPELERAAQLDPSLPDPPYTLGIIYMQQGKFSIATAQLRNATALQPENGDAWALLGSVLKDSGDPAGAVEALKRAVALQPALPSLHVQLAALESQAGQTEAAAADRKIAADLSRAAVTRQRASFALKSARALLNENKLPEAILQLNTAALADPTLAETHTLLADAYMRQGKPADAALERQRAIEIDRQRTEAAPHP